MCNGRTRRPIDRGGIDGVEDWRSVGAEVAEVLAMVVEREGGGGRARAAVR